ncbi:MAG: TonB-dependent receptor [Bacteroidetes bacterium]|nr:MAG: TonB-dependent receptor [Bacteroidota bacterium]
MPAKLNFRPKTVLKKAYVVKLLVFILLLLMALGAAAQRPRAVGMVVANVLDATVNMPLDGATVQLFALADSAFNPKTQLSRLGQIEFLDLAFGHYRLTISHVGFASLTIDSIFLRAERYDFNLGDLKLWPQQQQEATVIVLSEKPLVESRDGKIAYNVGESALSSSSNAAELLRNMPMVSNDPNGKLLLKGREPRILIDDKPVELNGLQLADLLEGLSGAGIERIEILQNPPPEYASEPGGVINIVTKKGKVGFIGKLALSAGTRGEANTSANVNYRSAKLNFAGSIGTSVDQLLGTNQSQRQNIYSDSSNVLKTVSSFKNINVRPNLRLQLDWEPTAKHQWSAVLQTNATQTNNHSNTSYQNQNRFAQLWRSSNRTNHTQGHSFSVNPQISYRYRAKNPLHYLQIIASAVVAIQPSHRRYNQAFFNPSTNAKLYDSSQEQRLHHQQQQYNLRLNYNLPLRTKGLNLSAGLVLASQHHHNVLSTYFYNALTNQPQLNSAFSNDIRFVQNLYAGRLGLTYDTKKSWHFVANLQAEQTQFRFGLAKTTGAQQGYFNLLPSATIRKNFGKQTSLSLLYRQSISRPGINQLNPAIDYNDPYNLRFGNPALLPNLTHHFDLNFNRNKGKAYINASAGFNHIANIINSIRSLQPDGKTFLTYQNIASKNEYELSIWGGYAVSKKLRFNLSGGLTYNQYSEASRQLLRYQNGTTSYLGLNYNLAFSPQLSFDGNFKFNRFAGVQGPARSNLATNLGVQHKFFKRRFAVALSAIDPFLPQRQKIITQGPNFLLNSLVQNRTKNYRLALSWLFSSTHKKPKST